MSEHPNPAAFPDCEQLSSGMTLRDHFAGLALASLLQVKNDLQPGESAYAAHEHLAAEDAYRFADAMLAERNREPQP